MGRPDWRGFTLIELMIVIVIIAIIAAISIPNLIRSRMAASESAAVAACKAYCTAQSIYRRTDYDNDGVLEYAQVLRGNYSLLEVIAGSGDLCLIDRAFGNAEGEPGVGIPKDGYVFAVLTRQGAAAPGGAANYINNGNMVGGYGLSAVPAGWDISGRNTFQIGVLGTVYQKDRGPVASTAHLTEYNPDSSWTVAE
jgi:prepilin-type N-terminal cleavage/methylation domain-containing protein